MYSCGMEKSLVGSRLKPKRMILKSCFIIFALARMNLIFCHSSQKSKVLGLLYIIKHLAILYGLVGTFLVVVACFGILVTWARVSASLQLAPKHLEWPDQWQEVPASGIFRIDLKSVSISKSVVLKLYPWEYNSARGRRYQRMC